MNKNILLLVALLAYFSFAKGGSYNNKGKSGTETPVEEEAEIGGNELEEETEIIPEEEETEPGTGVIIGVEPEEETNVNFDVGIDLATGAPVIFGTEVGEETEIGAEVLGEDIETEPSSTPETEQEISGEELGGENIILEGELEGAETKDCSKGFLSKY